MKPLLTFLLFLTGISLYGQGLLKELHPTQQTPITLSPEEEKQFIAFFNKASKSGYEDLTPSEKVLFDKFGEQENYYDSQGPGCSWYCGGSIQSVSSSSSLQAQGGNTYDAKNAHDFNYKNAWADGVPGYGVGEYLLYTFAPECPRVTEVIIANGYVKNETAWRNNSRVKKLKLYVNDKPYAILHLSDARSAQHFKIDPVGNSDRGDMEKLKKMPAWSLKFEIMEVYPGEKYDDVVISELWFEGIDVH